jgi:hypothetical protein
VTSNQRSELKINYWNEVRMEDFEVARSRLDINR